MFDFFKASNLRCDMSVSYFGGDYCLNRSAYGHVLVFSRCYEGSLRKKLVTVDFSKSYK